MFWWLTQQPCSSAPLPPAARYGQRRPELLRANFRRTLTLNNRNRVFAIIRTSQASWEQLQPGGKEGRLPAVHCVAV